jgi:eukaryotic-like serine/threonine-protein kinase
MDRGLKDFVILLAQSRLLTPDDVHTALARWKKLQNGAAADAATFTCWLVEQGLITEYQASLLARGHSEGFFISEYKILDRIGRGRMAGVYRAVHAGGDVSAIKVLPPSKAKDSVLMSRFQREARVASRLDHDNIVRTTQVGATGDLHYLVMEFLDGESLEVVLERRGRLEIDEAVRLIEQCLAGLQHIHERGMVHRDLKPGNLMLVPKRQLPEPDTTLNCTLKILDLGLCRIVSEDPGPEQGQEVQLTLAGSVLGTPDYLAPEQARDARSADIRSDIYSVGCVLYHALTGQPPHPDKNMLRQMVRHATETPEPIARLRPEAPSFLQRVLDRMLAKNPADRFSTPELALAALRDRTEDPTMAVPIYAEQPAAKIGGGRAPDENPFDFDPAESYPPTRPLPSVDSPPAQAAIRTQHESNTMPSDTGDIRVTPRSEPTAVRHRAADEFAEAQTKPAQPALKPARKSKPEPHIDVELIAPNAAPPPASGHGLTRRDALMLAIGGASVLVVFLIGGLISWLFHHVGE